ncbi:hypothetical protein VOLCADRAFT_96469 [Volvox carteri f. nagariensis]|uniref:Uncharacterized protein n=1 Tax=Volvox carteri f. nagariensis TaxID=3068 RepID=D8UA70_VOLCA|nr:uncharacterized protein VOLCADRAFT_96469 [Volvox carteri f. nagariensis]EFJ43422.1 hypothetical protein VOLCADRAFT_96469 [Volvox carteri f. nagariensis]|eukprot:XP_002955569.1 hypothetical protein VOLCADRAFT_96469 [Volvox carteri f. nagariensis]
MRYPGKSTGQGRTDGTSYGISGGFVRGRGGWGVGWEDSVALWPEMRGFPQTRGDLALHGTIACSSMGAGALVHHIDANAARGKYGNVITARAEMRWRESKGKVGCEISRWIKGRDAQVGLWVIPEQPIFSAKLLD